MLNSLPLFVGFRYVRARSHKFFVSFITWVSLLCVCLGVMALIVILSVMNGLEGTLRDRLLSLSAHARIHVAPDAADEPHVGVRVDERAAAEESVVVGSPGAVTERLLGFRELGFDTLSLIPVGPGEREQAERLGREVVPALREMAAT